jgi:hypothetical protein
LASPPPLRGRSEVDSYHTAAQFDATVDEPTAEYLEAYTYWGLIDLDGQSWRYSVPHIMNYAARHPADPRMVVEALVRSLGPPDSSPPRLATLTAEQESVVTAFLEHVLIDPEWNACVTKRSRRWKSGRGPTSPCLCVPSPSPAHPQRLVSTVSSTGTVPPNRRP